MKQTIYNITPARLAFILLCIIFALPLQAQQDEKKKQEAVLEHLREAQDYLEAEDFASAEASFRKAISKDPSNVIAKYNMGNLYYEKEENTNAEARLKQASEIAGSKDEKHRIFHNLGNSFMRQKNYKAAVEAYKDALRNVPTDEETRYNLALAKQMLEQQQQEQDQNKDKNDDQKEDQDQNQDEDQQGDGGDDQEKEGDPKDEGEDQEDQNQGDQDEEEKDKDEEKNQNKPDEGDEKEQPKQRPAQGQLSPEQIKSLLEAMNNEEKKVQDKINAEKAKGVKVRSEKDW